MITAITLLQVELDKYVKAKEKSIQAYDKGDISLQVHETHLKNLEPKIQHFQDVIKILEKEML